MKKNSKLTTFLIVLCFMVGVLSVAFAALSTTLNINFSKVTQTAQTWDVGFDITGSSNGTSITVNGSTGGTSTTGRSCGAATVSKESVTIANTSLSKPGDKCTWNLTIKNGGTISAKLSNITSTKPTESSVTCTGSGASLVCGNITYKLATNTSGTLLTKDSVLAGGSSLPVYLIAQYTGSNVNNSSIEQTGTKFTLTYSQN